MMAKTPIRAILFGAGMLSLFVGLFKVWAVRGSPTTTAVAFSLDASASVGDDYRNKFLPAFFHVLPHLIGCTIRVERFGGQVEVIFEGTLDNKVAQNLANHIAETSLFPPEVLGTPITATALRAADWLQKQKAQRKILALLTDGIEQVPSNMPLKVNQVARDVEAFILSTKVEHPLVASVMRNQGAKVFVSSDPDAFSEAIVDALSPRSQQLGVAMILIGLLTLLVIALPHLLRWMSSERREESEQEEQELPVSPPNIPLRLTVFLGGRVLSQRIIRPGERIRIATQGASNGDVRIPLSALRDVPLAGLNIAFDIEMREIGEFTVRNLGVPVVVNGRPIMQGGSGQFAEDALAVLLPNGEAITVRAEVASELLGGER